MKVELREREIELMAETEHERDALVRLRQVHRVEVRDGASRNPRNQWPPPSRDTNVVLVLPDPDNWGT